MHFHILGFSSLVPEDWAALQDSVPGFWILLSTFVSHWIQSQDPSTDQALAIQKERNAHTGVILSQQQFK